MNNTNETNFLSDFFSSKKRFTVFNVGSKDRQDREINRDTLKDIAKHFPKSHLLVLSLSVCGLALATLGKEVQVEESQRVTSLEVNLKSYEFREPASYNFVVEEDTVVVGNVVHDKPENSRLREAKNLKRQINYKSFSKRDLTTPDYKQIAKSSRKISKDDIDQIGFKYGVPDNLLYSMLLVESGGDCDAVSHKGAKGCFQFMDDTAKMFGLLTSTGKDYRDNPYASADAAARYLVWMHKHLGQRLGEDWNINNLEDWKTAVEGYNSGHNTVLNKYGYDEHPYKETREYQEKVLMLATGKGHYVKKNELLSDIASQYGIDYGTLVAMNLGLNNNNIKAGTVVSVDTDREVFWEVEPGDYVYRIASKTGVPAQTLLAYNELDPKDKLKVGDRLKIPVR